MKTLFVGNLPWSVDDAQLAQLFSQYGEVASARVLKDRQSGRSRGSGFVDIGDEYADQAITEMNGKEVDGRPLVVEIARPKEENRGPRGGYDGRRSGGNYGRNHY